MQQKHFAESNIRHKPLAINPLKIQFDGQVSFFLIEMPHKRKQHGRLSILPRATDNEILPSFCQFYNARKPSTIVHHVMLLGIAVACDIEFFLHVILCFLAKIGDLGGFSKAVGHCQKQHI
jgi:hypothetical protein